MRVLCNKFRHCVQPRTFVPLVLILLFLLFAGMFALTQEGDSEPDSFAPNEELSLDPPDGEEYANSEFAEAETEPFPIREPPGPPRWFRSNAGGMTLEETPSRLAALRNDYALVIDYIPPEEIDPRLTPFYRDGFTVEIRVLYEQGEEYRRQWVFRDEGGNTRLNAVFSPENIGVNDTNIINTNESGGGIEIINDTENEITGNEFIENKLTQNDETVFPDELAAGENPPAGPANSETGGSTGFIEIYDESARIIEDYWLYSNGGETVISYSYNQGALVTAITKQKLSGDEDYIPQYTDSFRYNRSFSLRNVVRLFHGSQVTEPVRQVFPYRVLEAAADQNFMSKKLSAASDFLETTSPAADTGFRMVYDTGSRGRILKQTLLDDNNEPVWVITNTWSGDRIVAMQRTEGEDEKRTEYEYDSAGNRILQRDIANGVLERQVHTRGDTETEELYLNGVVVLRAYWENGRKISEERVRRR